MEKRKKETEVILSPVLSYWHLANKGPNQGIHHKKGNCSMSYGHMAFTVYGKYKYKKRFRS
jgi:hypothetical protein